MIRYKLESLKGSKFSAMKLGGIADYPKPMGKGVQTSNGQGTSKEDFSYGDKDECATFAKSLWHPSGDTAEGPGTCMPCW